MAVISVVSFKGGVGKTTTAVHLAAHFAQFGRVALIDGDPNHSSALWAAHGGLPFEVTTFQRLSLGAQKYAHLVVDSAARPDGDELRDLAENSDLLIVPSNPEGMSIDALTQTCAALTTLEKAPQFRALLTIVPPSPGREAQEARELLGQLGIPTFAGQVRRSSAFTNASTTGVLVGRVRSSSAKAAAADYKGIFEEVGVLLGLEVRA